MGKALAKSKVETILEKRDLAIGSSAALSLSRFPISFALIIRVDRTQRDRNTALLPDSFHLDGLQAPGDVREGAEGAEAETDRRRDGENVQKAGLGAAEDDPTIVESGSQVVS